MTAASGPDEFNITVTASDSPCSTYMYLYTSKNRWCGRFCTVLVLFVAVLWTETSNRSRLGEGRGHLLTPDGGKRRRAETRQR